MIHLQKGVASGLDFLQFTRGASEDAGVDPRWWRQSSKVKNSLHVPNGVAAPKAARGCQAVHPNLFDGGVDSACICMCTVCCIYRYIISYHIIHIYIYTCMIHILEMDSVHTATYQNISHIIMKTV